MKRTLTSPELRQFGLTLALAVAAIFGLALPWLFDTAYRLWPWLAGGLIAAAALALPRALAPVYAAWRPVAVAVGWVNTRLILGLVFFLVILPFGLLARLAGKLQYAGRIEASAKTYRVESESGGDPRHYERPF